MACRGIRGAITVKENTEIEILKSCQELLKKIIVLNKIKIEDIVFIYFSVTPDLTQISPAKGAREMGWKYVPMICTLELNPPNSLKKCLRVLMVVNSEKKQEEIRHIYLKGAKILRSDLIN